MGHADYYPNGGWTQSGCSGIMPQCSHERAQLFFIESIKNQNSFLAFPCKSDYKWNNGKGHLPIIVWILTRLNKQSQGCVNAKQC